MDGHYRRTAVVPACPRFAHLLLLSWFGLLLIIPGRDVNAATVVAYDFDDGTGGFLNAPTQAAAHLSASAWQDTDGTLRSSSGNPGEAVSASHFDDGNTFALSLQVAPGHVLSLDGYSFDHRVSSTGPTLWTLSVAGRQQASGTTLVGDFTSASGGFTATGLTGEVSVALYAIGASSSAGTWRIDNFQLQGSVAPLAAPLPPSLLLLVSALLCIPRRRRR